jgi:hypothetical protein
MNQTIYNTKPAVYQMQLTVFKDQLIKEAARYLEENSYVFEVTLEEVMDEYHNISEPSTMANKRHTQKVLC